MSAYVKKQILFRTDIWQLNKYSNYAVKNNPVSVWRIQYVKRDKRQYGLSKHAAVITDGLPDNMETCLDGQ